MFIPTSGRAFSNYFQYQSFSDEFFLRAEDPSALDSEYRSDVLTYELSLPELVPFYRSSKKLLWSIGSLSTERFYTERHIDLAQKFNKRLNFRVLYTETEDYEYQNQRFLLELSYQLFDGFFVGGFGDGSFNKSEDDIAVFFEWRPSNHMVRFSYEWIDFERNKKSLEGDRWTSRSPRIAHLYGNNFNAINASYLYEWGLRHGQRASREFAASGEIKEFAETSALVRFIEVNQASNLEMSFQWDQWQRGLLDPTFETHHQVERYQTQVGLRNMLWLQQSIDLGLRYVERHDYKDGVQSALMDLLPFFYIDLGKLSEDWQSRMGGEISLRNTRGSKENLPEGGKKSATHGRINYFLSYLPNENIKLNLVFTFDADQLGSPYSWEGGSGQLFVRF